MYFQRKFELLIRTQVCRLKRGAKQSVLMSHLFLGGKFHLNPCSVTLSINKWLIVAVLVGVVILVVALTRGCQNEKKLASVNIDYEGQISRLKKNAIEDHKQLSAYKDTMQLLDGQLALSKNKELFLNEDLGKANDRISILLKKHVPIKPSLDSTSFTLVDNTFINECADCFKELGSGQQLVKKYKAEKENQEQICIEKLNVKDNRINHLEKANKEVTSSYMALIDITKDANTRRRMLYFSYGILWSAYVPKMGGMGLMYQDKRLRQYGVKAYFGAYKPMLETQVNMPLSFKKR